MEKKNLGWNSNVLASMSVKVSAKVLVNLSKTSKSFVVFNLNYLFQLVELYSYFVL